AGNPHTSEYDAAGNRTKVVEPLGRTTVYDYDAVNRLTRVTNSLLHSATTAYDDAGNVTRVTDHRGNFDRFEYDKINRRTLATDRDQRQRSFTYDALKRMTQEQWLGVGASGYQMDQRYDEAGRLTLAADTNSRYTYGYDRADNLTLVDNSGTPGAPSVQFRY